MQIRRFVLAAAGALLAVAGVGRSATISFSYSGSITQFTAPTTGTYDITAVGAAGGVGSQTAAGLGASVHASFSLTGGQVLDILVGGKGGDGPTGGGGGGGATFVVIDGGSALLVGGGGGGGGCFVPGTGQNAGAVTIETGGPGNGGGAFFVPVNGTGAGGGGLTSNGANGADPVFLPTPAGGKSFANNGAGGVGSQVGGKGGFGGGGGGSDVGAGGGGGFTGGHGGDADSGAGFAGSSFYNPALATFENFSSASAVADGSVTIESAAIPDPNSAVLAGLLLTGVYLIRSRRRVRVAAGA